MFVYMKRIHKELGSGVAFIAALILSDSMFAQNVGGVIKGTPTQQAQAQYQASGSQSVNQSGRLLLELQSLREEMASLRNQVEQQGYQLRKLQNGSQSAQISQNQPVNNSGYGNSGVGSSNSGFNPALGEIPSGVSSNQQQTYQPAVPASPQQGSTSGSANNGVNFPLLPQDQVTNQSSVQQQSVPQLVPQAQQQAQSQFQQQGQQQGQQQPVPQLIPQTQQQVQQQVQQQAPQQAQLSRQAQLLQDGNKGIKTNLNELELYNNGIDKLSGQDYRAAASIFSAQLQNFPTGEKAGDGYFWLAETFYILDDLDSSAKSYQSLVDLFPRHVRAPKALLKLISVHLDRKDEVSAKVSLNVLLNKYPNTQEASSARSTHATLL